jgi:hypothetical protein
MLYPLSYEGGVFAGLLAQKANKLKQCNIIPSLVELPDQSTSYPLSKQASSA